MPAAISWTNHCTTTGLTVTFSLLAPWCSAIAFDSAYPAVNMLDPDPSKTARVNYTRNATAVNEGGGVGFIMLTVDWSTSAPTDRTTRVVGFENVRFGAGVGTSFVRTYNHDGTGLFINTPYAAADRVPIPGTTDRYNLRSVHTADHSAGQAACLWYAPASTADYAEFGFVWAGPALALADGVDRDWKVVPVDPSEVERLRLGALVAQRLPTRQKLVAPVSRQAYNTALGTPGSASALNFRSLFREAGLSSPVLVVPRSSSLHAMQTAGIYGALTKLADVSHQRGNRFAVEIEAEEIR